MTDHVRVLAILQIVYASIGLLVGMAILLFFGGLAAIVGLSASIDNSLVAVPVLTLIGGIIASVIILLSLPRLMAGIGLLRLRNWGRILTFVVCILGLIDFPIGTGLGIYGLWVMTHHDTAVLFEAGKRD